MHVCWVRLLLLLRVENRRESIGRGRSRSRVSVDSGVLRRLLIAGRHRLSPGDVGHHIGDPGGWMQPEGLG